MDLLLLASDIEEEVLLLDIAPGARPISERGLRDPVLTSLDWIEQRR